ncbi:MAG TPA: hypothetical protein VLX61_00975 [Anaerolineales bacterium]|nr:hypothetical protein [Anaerolineales bacterium]
MTLDLSFPHQRALDDLLQAERLMREKNESVIHGLQQTLTDLAIRLDGERFESLRRDDPRVPASWTVPDWNAFFAKVSLPSRGWNAPDVLAQRELQQQVEGLKARVRTLEAQLEEARARKIGSSIPDPHASRASSPLVVRDPAEKNKVLLPDAQPGPDDGTTPSADDLVGEVKSILNDLPKTAPAPFDKILNGGNRTGVDLDQIFLRYWITLYLIGRRGLSSSMEMSMILAKATGANPRTGSVRRAMEHLADINMLFARTIGSGAPRTSLKLNRLSPAGEKLYEAVFHVKPVENEWARINRLHQGEQYPVHAMCLIAFAIHARRRGYRTRVLPESKRTPTPPDLWISREAESLYVEVELSEKENPAKWRNQAMLNGGKVALCAGMSKGRETLVGDCKALHLTGYASDLETMVEMNFEEIAADDPLWLEIW